MASLERAKPMCRTTPYSSGWAHCLYTFIFPVLLAVTAVSWTIRQIRDQSPWSLTLWCDCAVATMLLASLAMYLYAVHGLGDTSRTSCEKDTPLSYDTRDDTQRHATTRNDTQP